MIINCSNCSTRFYLDEEKFKKDFVKVRCSQCGKVFTVYKDNSGSEKTEANQHTTQTSQNNFSDDFAKFEQNISPEMSLSEPETVTNSSEHDYNQISNSGAAPKTAYEHEQLVNLDISSKGTGSANEATPDISKDSTDENLSPEDNDFYQHYFNPTTDKPNLEGQEYQETLQDNSSDVQAKIEIPEPEKEIKISEKTHNKFPSIISIIPGENDSETKEFVYNDPKNEEMPNNSFSAFNDFNEINIGEDNSRLFNPDDEIKNYNTQNNIDISTTPENKEDNSNYNPTNSFIDDSQEKIEAVKDSVPSENELSQALFQDYTFSNFDQEITESTLHAMTAAQTKENLGNKISAEKIETIEENLIYSELSEEKIKDQTITEPDNKDKHIVEQKSTPDTEENSNNTKESKHSSINHTDEIEESEKKTNEDKDDFYEDVPFYIEDDEKPKRNILKTILVTLLVIVILLIAGVIGLYFTKGPGIFSDIGLGFITDTFQSKKGSLEVVNTAVSYVTNNEAGDLMVIRGIVVNNDKEPRSLSKLKVLIFGAGNKVVANKTASGGIKLKNEEIATLSQSEIDELMKKPAKNLMVQPGGSIPFTIILSNIPKTAVDYSVELLTQ
ncbi:MAG: zinc-ribbon domain-containing protein [Desulfuromonadales bacterium]|nr:zinc-ribbon domain-containing protein [Desulfuromonadales bacterium]